MGHEKQPKAKIMKALSKVVRAAKAASPTSMAKEYNPFDTNEKKIRELCVLRVNRLPVVRYEFIDALIEEYDARLKTMAILQEAITALLKRAETAETQVLLTERMFGEKIVELTERAEKAEKDLHFLLLDQKAAGVSEVGYDVYAAAAKVLGCNREEAKDQLLAASHNKVLVQGLTGTNPQGLTGPAEPTLNAEEVAREAGDTHEVGGEG